MEFSIHVLRECAPRLPRVIGPSRSRFISSCGQGCPAHVALNNIKRFFLFLYFLFLFFTKIYFRFGNLQKYTPAAPLPGGRGLSSKKKTTKNCAEVPGGPAARQRGGQPSRPPGRGAAGPGRPPAGRPPPTLYKVLAAPHPLICLTKNPEKRKEKRGVRERQSGEALPNFQAGDCR